MHRPTVERMVRSLARHEIALSHQRDAAHDVGAAVERLSQVVESQAVFAVEPPFWAQGEPSPVPDTLREFVEK